MAENSKIQWTDHTINFWTGCKKVSAGCKFCYMYRDKDRWKKDPTEVIKVKDSSVNKVLKIAKPGDKIFTCSWSDFFIEEADVWRDWAWDIIRSRLDLKWQILTKRPERIMECLPSDWGDGWDNVWLGVSIESDNEKEHRINTLCQVPAKVRFISAEPLIGFIGLGNDQVVASWNFQNCIDWLIIGGESGNEIGKYRYRPCELDWITEIVNDCREYGIPVFVKQLGTHLSKTLSLQDRHGGNINEFPEHLQIRQFPTEL